MKTRARQAKQLLLGKMKFYSYKEYLEEAIKTIELAEKYGNKKDKGGRLFHREEIWKSSSNIQGHVAT